MSEQISDLLPVIKEAAGVVARQWPDTVEADDVEQDIALRLLQSPRSVNKLIERMGQAERKTAVIKIGHQIAAQARADYEVFSGQYRYGVQEVRALLDNGALTIDRSEVSASAVDLDEGLALMLERNPSYVGVLYRVFRDGEDTDHRQRIARAVELLTELMNRVHFNRRPEGPGARRARANSAPINDTERD